MRYPSGESFRAISVAEAHSTTLVTSAPTFMRKLRRAKTSRAHSTASGPPGCGGDGVLHGADLIFWSCRWDGGWEGDACACESRRLPSNRLNDSHTHPSPSAGRSAVRPSIDFACSPYSLRTDLRALMTEMNNPEVMRQIGLRFLYMDEVDSKAEGKTSNARTAPRPRLCGSPRNTHHLTYAPGNGGCTFFAVVGDDEMGRSWLLFLPPPRPFG